MFRLLNRNRILTRWRGPVFSQGSTDRDLCGGLCPGFSDMTKIRAPAVAGRFYPADPRELRAAVRAYVDAVRSGSGEGECLGVLPKAIIAPHAGYTYSGATAGAVYALLSPLRGVVERVVLLGPAHRVALSGFATSDAEAFATPLGSVPIDVDAIRGLSDLSYVSSFDPAHAEEHCLEVHLPFLQEVLGAFRLVPFVVGEANAGQVGEVLERLWGGRETLIVVSSDLSHFHDYAAAQTLDRGTAHRIETLTPVDEQGACGRRPINGLLLVARRYGLTAKVVDVRNSGDADGGRDRVVGYGGFVFTASGE